MKKFSNELSKGEKFEILLKTFPKILRGLFLKPFLGQSKGLFFLGKGVELSHLSAIHCGKNVKFEAYSEIQGLAKNGLIFGDNVTVGRYTMIRPSSYYGIDKGAGLAIGKNSSIGPYAYIGCSGQVTIGENVMFGPKCSIFAENHSFSDRTLTIKEQGVHQRGVVIEDDCWIGSNVVILDGVTIGRGSVIGAGTLVTKDVPEGSIVTDRRVKQIRSRE